ncbi:MAG: GAF domain-containing protein, partial [Candidatus Rokuibacteriota bacterium]
MLRTGQPILCSDLTDADLQTLARDQRHLEILRSLGARSLMIVPLRARSRILGAILLASIESGRRYGAADLAFAMEVADRAALAVDNARLFTESEARRREAERLSEVGRLLAQTLDPDVVAGRVVESVRELLGVALSALYKTDPRSGDLVALAYAGDWPPHFRPDVVLRHGTGVAGLALRERRPVVIADILDDPRVVHTPEVRASLEATPYRAALALPLVVRDQVIGALALGDRPGWTFDDRQVALAQAFADQAALALENARLYDGVAVRAARLATLAHVNRLVSSSLDMAEVLHGIAGAAAEIMSVSAVSFWVADEATRTLELRAFSSDALAADFPYRALSFERGVLGEIARTRRAVHIPDVREDERVVAREWFARHGFTSFLGLPIAWHGSLIGVLSLNTRAPFQVSADDEALLDNFTSQAAVAIRNAQLYLDAERRRREAEVVADLARTINASLATVFQAVAEAARELTGADLARVALWDAEAQAMVYRHLVGTRYEHYDAVRLVPGEGLAGWVMTTGQAARAPNVLEDPR